MGSLCWRQARSKASKGGAYLRPKQTPHQPYPHTHTHPTSPHARGEDRPVLLYAQTHATHHTPHAVQDGVCTAHGHGHEREHQRWLGQGWTRSAALLSRSAVAQRPLATAQQTLMSLLFFLLFS